MFNDHSKEFSLQTSDGERKEDRWKVRFLLHNELKFAYEREFLKEDEESVKLKRELDNVTAYYT